MEQVLLVEDMQAAHPASMADLSSRCQHGACSLTIGLWLARENLAPTVHPRVVSCLLKRREQLLIAQPCQVVTLVSQQPQGAPGLTYLFLLSIESHST